MDSYDYAVVRIIPSVERGECINSGVILFCRSRRFLGSLTKLDIARLCALDPRADAEEIGKHLDLIPRICAGEEAAGPIAALTPAERFHWLVAPRSAVIQTSPVHSGTCTDPNAVLERLFKKLVAMA